MKSCNFNFPNAQENFSYSEVERRDLENSKNTKKLESKANGGCDPIMRVDVLKDDDKGRENCE